MADAPYLGPDTDEVVYLGPDTDPIVEFNTGEGPVESALSSLGRGFTKVGTGTVEGLGQLSQTMVRNANPVGWAAKAGVPFAQEAIDFMQKPGRALEEAGASAQTAAEEMMPVNPLYQEAPLTKAAGVAGQVTGQMASLLTGATITKAPKILQALGLGQAGLMGLESGYEEADRLGVQGWQRDALAASYAAAEAGVEGWSGFGTQPFIKGLLGEAKELLTSGAIKKAAKTALGEGLEEPVTGVIQAAASNAFANEDPNRPGFTLTGQPLPSLNPTDPAFLKARAEEFALGAFGGSLFAGAQYLGSRPKVEQAKKLKQKVDLAVEVLSQNPNPTPEEQADLTELQQRQAELDTIIPQSEAVIESTATTAAIAGVPEAVIEEAEDPDTAITASVIAEQPETELATDEIETQPETPVTEALLTADSEDPGSETAVEPTGDLPVTAAAAEEPFVAPEDEIVTEAQDAPAPVPALQTPVHPKAANPVMGKPGYRVTDQAKSDEYGKNGGWKLHLAASPENYKAVDEWLLKNHKGQYKLLQGGDPGHSDFTLYIGSKAKADAFSERLNQEIGDLLNVPELDGDRAFGSKVGGRFDVQKTGTLKDVPWQSYGRKGIPGTGGDWGTQNQYIALSRARKAGDLQEVARIEKDLDRQFALIEKQVTERYGEFYTGKQQPDVLALATQSPEQVTTDREKTSQKAAIAQKQAAPLKGSLKAEDTTPDMLDPTAGGLFAQSAPTATKIEEETAKLDPYLANLGRSTTTSAGVIAAELSEYTEEERTALQKTLKAPDNKPRTLAKALKEIQPRTGGKGSAYQAETRAQGTRRDAVDEQLDRDEGIVRSRRRSMRAQEVVYTGVTAKDAETAKQALVGLLPTAQDAWIGRASEVLDAPGIRSSFVRSERLLDPSLTEEDAEEKFRKFTGDLPGSKLEGFTSGGRPYIIIDEVGVTEEDRSPARAVRRILIHEDAHEAVEAAIASDPALKVEWEGIKNDISAEDLDALAADRYKWLSSWRIGGMVGSKWMSAEQMHDNLAHEWIAEQAEVLERGGDVDVDVEINAGLMQRILQFFRKIIAKYFGEQPKSISDARVMDFIEAGRAARSREVRMGNPLRPSMQRIFGELDIPEMPKTEPAFTDWITIVDKKLATELAWRPFAVAWQGENPTGTTKELYAAWEQEISDPESPAIAQGQTEAFMLARQSPDGPAVYSPEPSQTEPERDSPVRFSMQPSYSSQSEERTSDYKDAVEAMPESGKDYVQFLGSLTRTPRISQAVRPMVDFARALMGSYQGDEIEVNAENTERVKELAAQAFQKGKPGAQFAEDLSEQFRDSGFSNNGQHQGSVAAGVLQMEILDYAVRLAGEGDSSMALALMPYANDVAAADHASLSNAGRALQMRSMAGQQKGFWTILNSLAKGERELAEKNPIYKDLRAALFSDEVKAETAAAVEQDLASAEAQKALNPDVPLEDILETYLPRAVGIMSTAEREITSKLFADMAELEVLLAKQEAMQAPPSSVKASMQTARGMNDPVAIQQRIDELKAGISKGLKALDQFKTSEATKETRKKALNKTPKAKKAMGADADAKRMLDRLENKEKRTKKDEAPWKTAYKDQIANPKTEAAFIDGMLKLGVSPAVSQKLFDAAETASADVSKKAKEKARKETKGPAQTFSAWVGGVEQDGIEDFVDLVAKNITAAGFNETGFRRALANKFAAVDPALIDATTESVKARLEEQDAEAKDGPEPPDFDARAKKLTANAIARKSGAEQDKLKDPMEQAIKARMKGDIDAAGLKGKLLSLGIEPETAFAVGKKVEEDMADKAQEDAKRKSKALAEKLAREAAMPSRTADQIVDEMDAMQTEWRKKDKPGNPIRELAAKARKAPDVTKGPTTFPTWEEFTRQFIALGVNPTKAAILVSRLKAENAKDRSNRVIRKRETASNSTPFINSIVRDIFGSSLEEQQDPAWRRQTMVNAFMKNGMNDPEAQKAADWLEYRFNTHLKQAQEKAAQKAAKDLKMKRPTLEKLVKAIRSRAVDPLNADPVTKALAAEAGFGGITPEQFTELAKLEGQMRGPYQSQRAKAAARMLDIALAAKPPKDKMEILTQAWISSALSSLSTISLSAVHAGFIPVRRLMTDIAGIAMDVTTGKTKPADAAQMMVNTVSNLQHAASYMLATAKFSGMNDAYTQHIVEFINQMHSMQADLQRAVQTIKDPNASGTQKGKAAIKIAFTSTDIVRRILSTADETWGSMIQDFILRNEAMRTLVQKGKMTPTAAAMLFTAASNEGRIAGERHLNETGNQTEATLVERDATQNALLQAVRVAAGEEAAEDVGTTASLESPMELGNRRAEDAPLWDFVNTGLEWVKQLAIATRRKNELAGRMITGFVTVPANVLNRSAYFTPLGIARALYKKGKLRGNPEKIQKSYEETMKTEGQQRMRLIEGIVGTMLIAMLIALKPEDDEEGVVITGSGPENRGLREAWTKKGNQPNRIQWVDKKGNVRWSVPYARGGFDHLNLPFTLVGTMDDMKLKGIKPQPANVEWGTQYMQTALKALFDQAKFFGLKNVAAMPTQNLSDKSLASQAAYLASPVMPWSGLTKSLGRMWTGPTDQSSVRSAVLAQLPFTNFYASPSLNALGDQRGAAPTDEQWEKALMSGNFFTVGAKNKGPDEDLYTMMIDRGIAPSVPFRATLERQNGFLEDSVWQDYLKTRGKLIKDGMRKNLRRLKTLPYKDAQNLMEKISGGATKEAKNRLRLD